MSSGWLVYISYDRFPAPKGAATHIREFVTALAGRFREVDLITVGGDASAQNHGPIPHLPPNVRHWELPAVGPSLVERVLCFRSQLNAWMRKRRPDVIHVRSIYEGYPIAKNRARYCDRFVFEMNGLPSIELKYHYPKAADDRELQKKLLAQEKTCLENADLIITVSDVNAGHLRWRGVDESRLVVIPNGVDPSLFSYKLPRATEARPLSLLYSGTLSTWQGVDTVVEALSLLRRDIPAQLTIAGSGRRDQFQRLTDLATKLDVSEHVNVLDAVNQRQLGEMHHEADVVVVPLMPNDRNLVQGCCPLKLLEAMSAGTPVVASKMPVVSTIARDEVEALLVRPGSAKSIKDAVLRLRTEPELAQQLSQNARSRIEQHFLWAHANRKLITAYDRLDLK